MCTPWPYVNHECLAGSRGLLPWEFEHFYAQHAGFEFGASTVHALHDEDNEYELISEAHFELAEHIVEIDARSELDDLQTLQYQPIIYLDSFIHVIFPDSMAQHKQAYDNVCEECTVLNTEAYTAIFDLDGNRGRKNAQPMANLGLSHRPARLRQGKLHTRAAGVVG